MKGKKAADGETPEYVIVKCSGDYTQANAEAALAAEAGKYTKAVVVVPAGIGDSENSKILYRLILLKAMYGEASTITDDEIRQAAAELGVNMTDPPLYRLDAAPAEQPAQDS